MSSTASSDNLVSLNDGHRQLLADHIKTLETRVREMETTLIAQATRLHDTVSERLDSLFDDNTIVEFDSFPGNEGNIKLSNSGRKEISVGRSKEVFDTLNATREQLRLLNETIENMQLAR